MRLRTDSWYWAGIHRAVLNGGLGAPALQGWGELQSDFDATPIAELGDVWRSGGFASNQFGGYVLTCPETVRCSVGVHPWWHAYDCPAGRLTDGVCKRGAGRDSCWDWSGSPENGTLTALPSLHVLVERGGCGWHGYLRDGVMSPA